VVSNSKQNKSNFDRYDWLVDIELLQDVTAEGWPIQFGPEFYNTLSLEQKKSLIHLSYDSGSNIDE